MLIAVSMAEYINRRNNGPLVAPWELEQLPDEWLDLYETLRRSEPAPKRRNPLEHVFAQHRADHPSFRKYMS